MAEEIRHPDGRLEHPEVRFETKDANAAWIFAILGGTVIFLGVVHGSVLGFFIGYRDHLARIDRSPFPLAPGPNEKPPRQPRLEQIERLAGSKEINVYAREAAKLKTLKSYGKTEAEGYIHIPIDKAMQMLVEKKMLKSRPEQPAEEEKRSRGLVDSGEPNSGRLLRGGPK